MFNAMRKQFPDIDKDLTDLENKTNNIIPGYIGTEFPTNITNGALCYRTDQKCIYQYDGENWYKILSNAENIDLGIITEKEADNS